MTSLRGRRADQRGFNLTELMLTVTILGIMSSVVIVAKLSFGSTNACASDARMLRNAEATFFVSNGRYGTQAELVAQGLIHQASTLHDVAPSGLSYTVTELGKCVGSGTADADNTAAIAPTTIPGLTMLVSGSDGHPVQFVTAQYRQGNGAWQTLGQTNAKGFVNGPVASGTYDVRAVLHGATSTVPGVHVGVGALVYVSTVPLTAQILTYGGAQIQNVLMNASVAGANGWFSFGPTGASGASVDVLPGTYDVQTTYNNVTATQTSQSVSGATTVTFQTAPLTVRVLTKTGNGVAGAVVTITPTGGTALGAQVTDVDGTITLDLLPSNYDISAVYQIPNSSLTNTVSLDAVPLGTQPDVAELRGNR